MAAGDGESDWTEASLKVVEHYGGHVNPTQRGWQTLSCINPDHDDNHKSARVSLRLGVYHCNSCPCSGPLVKVIQQIEGVDYGSAIATLENLVGESGTHISKGPNRKHPRGGSWPGVLDEPWNNPGSHKLL